MTTTFLTVFIFYCTSVNRSLFFRGWEFTSHGASTGCIFYTRVEDGRRNSIPVSSSWWPPPVNLYIIHTIYHNTIIHIFGPLTSILHPHILLFAPGLDFWYFLVCFDSHGPFSYWQCSLCWGVRCPQHIVLVAFGVTDYGSLNTWYFIFLFYLYSLHCVYDCVCFLI